MHYRHIEERDRVLQAIGPERFKAIGHEEKYGDLEVPPCFASLFAIFLDIYGVCRDGVMSYPDIQSYCATTQTSLSVFEVGLLRKMATWAADEKYKAFEESR